VPQEEEKEEEVTRLWSFGMYHDLKLLGGMCFLLTIRIINE
jgi:hypothetical protein